LFLVERGCGCGCENVREEGGSTVFMWCLQALLDECRSKNHWRFRSRYASYWK
jgi:hypothetical protein